MIIYRQKKSKYIFIASAGYIERNEYNLLRKYFYLYLQWYLYLLESILNLVIPLTKEHRNET